MTHEEALARVAELESENARLARENAELRLPHVPQEQVAQAIATQRFWQLRDEIAKAAEVRDAFMKLHNACFNSGAYERLLDTNGRTHDGLKTSAYMAKVLTTREPGQLYSEFIMNFLAFECAPEDAQWLAKLQHAEAERDAGYRGRTLAAVALVRACLAMGMKGGVYQDAQQVPEWATVLAVELPSGQVTWHIADGERGLLEGLPDYPETWDGHTPAARDERLAAARFEERIHA